MECVSLIHQVVSQAVHVEIGKFYDSQVVYLQAFVPLVCRIHLAIGLPLYLRYMTLLTWQDWQRGGNDEAGES